MTSYGDDAAAESSAPDPGVEPDPDRRPLPLPESRPNPYAGAAVVVMAIGLTVSLSASLVVAAMQATPISQQFAAVLSALGGAVIGSIATYLGSHRN